MLAELSEFADREITKKELISRAIQPAKDQFNKKLDELKNNPKKFLQSELAETLQLASSDLAQNGYIATGGFVGGAIGSVAGPKGALAGDLLGARVVRRGITDTKAVTQAIRNRQNLPELEPEFGVNPRVQKFGQIMEDAIQRSKQEISEQGRAGVFDDVGGWAAGNAVGVGMLGGSIPGAGMGPGMAGSIYAQSVEKRMRDTGEDLVTAATNLISDKVKQGNAREQALRDKIKEHWTRLLYLEGDM